MMHLENILNNKARFCKMCFNEIKDNSLHFLLDKNSQLCEECFNKFEPKFIHFKVDGVHGLALYNYDQTIKDLLFKFKGCFDYELKDVFMDRYYWYLKARYSGYIVVPIPSYYLDDQTRGFNHVQEIYNRLNLQIEKAIIKTKKEKQANKNKKEREKVGEIFKLENVESIKNKKVLIVDDVMTTGSSIKAAIKLIREGKPKKIEVLVIAKNIEKKKK